MQRCRIPVVAMVLCLSCKPSAPPVYVPTPDEKKWDRSHDSEMSGDITGALAGYAALCASKEPYERACFDHARLLYETASPAKARENAAELIRQLPDHALSQPAVKRLARSYAKADAFGDGIDALSKLASSLEKTEIHDTILFEISKLARRMGDASREEHVLVAFKQTYGRWDSQLWDNAVWRLSLLYREQQRTDAEIAVLRELLDARESSWLIGSYNSPYHDDALLRLGEIYMAQKAFPTAYSVYTALFKIASSRLSVDGALGAAEALIEMGKRTDACRQLDGIRNAPLSRRRQIRMDALIARADCQ